MTPIKTSPYDWNLPVTDPKLFAGRKDKLELVSGQLHRTLSSKIPMSIVFHGERRVGKTSLLNRISEICEKEGFISIRFVATGELGSNVWEFWHEIMSMLLIEIAKKNIKIIENAAEGAGFGFKTPEKITEQSNLYVNSADCWFTAGYTQHLGGARIDIPSNYLIEHEITVLNKKILETGTNGIILMIDEAQEIKDKLIVEQMRAILQSKWGLIFSGTSELLNLFNNPAQPFYNQVTIVPIRNFANGDDIVQCALAPLRSEEQTLMSPMSLENIARLSQGKPNQVRLICDAIYNRYAKGQQKDLNITIDVLDDVIDIVAQGYQDKVKLVQKLSSVDLELLYNMTRYPQWSIKDLVDVDESFRGEAVSELASSRRASFYQSKQQYFEQMGLLDKQNCSIVGGEYMQLYVRFLYEIRKFGDLKRNLVFGKGPPTSFGEKAEKLVSAITYALGRSPELQNFVVHSYLRDEGDIVETVRQRYLTLAALMKSKKQSNVIDFDQFNNIISDCFQICRLLKESGNYYVLIVAIRNLENPRELTHIELYFSSAEEQGPIELTSLFKIMGDHAKNARVSLESYGGFITAIPDLKQLLKVTTGKDLQELTSQLDILNKWKLFSVQRLIEHPNGEEGVETKEATDEQLNAEWIKVYGKNGADEAIKLLSDLLKKTQKRTNRAWLMNDLGYIESGLSPDKRPIARRHLESALSLHYSNLPITLLNLSVVDIDDGLFDKAIEKIENALMLTLNISQINASYLRLRLPENHLNFKVKWEQYPANVLEASYINLVYATLKLNGIKDAEKILNEGTELIPSSLRLKHARARLWLFQKKAAPAVAIYSELAKHVELPEGIQPELSVFSRRIRRSTV